MTIYIECRIIGINVNTGEHTENRDWFPIECAPTPEGLRIINTYDPNWVFHVEYR